MSTCELPESGFDLSEVALIFPELRRIAEMLMNRQGPGHTLQASALVNEAWIRLRATGRWKDKLHFLAAAAQAMRHILMDHAKRKRALKRPPDGLRQALEGTTISGGEKPVEIEALEEALSFYESINPHNARVVELRFYFRMMHKEIGEALGTSERDSQRSWEQAREWLLAFLDEDDDEDAAAAAVPA